MLTYSMNEFRNGTRALSFSSDIGEAFKNSGSLTSNRLKCTEPKIIDGSMGASAGNICQDNTSWMSSRVFIGTAIFVGRSCRSRLKLDICVTWAPWLPLDPDSDELLDPAVTAPKSKINSFSSSAFLCDRNRRLVELSSVAGASEVDAVDVLASDCSGIVLRDVEVSCLNANTESNDLWRNQNFIRISISENCFHLNTRHKNVVKLTALPTQYMWNFSNFPVKVNRWLVVSLGYTINNSWAESRNKCECRRLLPSGD